jgi:hypothetical protein
MNNQFDETLGRYYRLEEAATFFLSDAFEHAYLAAQLEVAGLIFGERIMAIEPEPDWEIPQLPDNLLDLLRSDVQVVSNATTSKLAQAWDEAQAIAPSSGRKLSRKYRIRQVEIVGHIINLAACVESAVNRHLFLLKESGDLENHHYTSLDRTEVLPKVLFAFKDEILGKKLPIDRLKYLYKLRNQAVHFKASSAHSIEPTVEDLSEMWRNVGQLFRLIEGELSQQQVDRLARRVSDKWFE